MFKFFLSLLKSLVPKVTTRRSTAKKKPVSRNANIERQPSSETVPAQQDAEVTEQKETSSNDILGPLLSIVSAYQELLPDRTVRRIGLILVKNKDKIVVSSYVSLEQQTDIYLNNVDNYIGFEDTAQLSAAGDL